MLQIYVSGIHSHFFPGVVIGIAMQFKVDQLQLGRRLNIFKCEGPGEDRQGMDIGHLQDVDVLGDVDPEGQPELDSCGDGCPSNRVTLSALSSLSSQKPFMAPPRFNKRTEVK